MMEDKELTNDELLKHIDFLTNENTRLSLRNSRLESLLVEMKEKVYGVNWEVEKMYKEFFESNG